MIASKEKKSLVNEVCKRRAMSFDFKDEAKRKFKLIIIVINFKCTDISDYSMCPVRMASQPKQIIKDRPLHVCPAIHQQRNETGSHSLSSNLHKPMQRKNSQFVKPSVTANCFVFVSFSFCSIIIFFVCCQFKRTLWKAAMQTEQNIFHVSSEKNLSQFFTSH